MLFPLRIGMTDAFSSTSCKIRTISNCIFRRQNSVKDSTNSFSLLPQTTKTWFVNSPPLSSFSLYLCCVIERARLSILSQPSAGLSFDLFPRYVTSIRTCTAVACNLNMNTRRRTIRGDSSWEKELTAASMPLGTKTIR